MTDPVPGPQGAEGAPPPRPQFGEYASPEEQQRRIQARPAPVPPPVPQNVAVPVAGTAPSAARTVDRFVTVGLLVYGLINTIATIPQMTDYATYSQTLLSLMGVSATLADPGAAAGWAVAAALVMGLGWLATAALAYLRLRTGRLAFWIPIVGAIVFLGVSGVLMAVPLVNDPNVLDAVTGLGG